MFPHRDILRDKMKVVLITGAAQGIGYELTRHFCKNNYFVILVDIQKQAGEAKEKELQELGYKSKFYECNLENEEAVKRLSEQLHDDFEHIDLIIHNAKHPSREKDVLNNIEREWDGAFNVMLKHPILLTHLLLDLLQKSTNASIIYIGSTNARFISQQPLTYHVIKGALSQATRYLACEYGKFKIRINLLHPGIVDIPGRSKMHIELYKQTIEEVIPLQRPALAEEVGHCCLFLASEGARYITGTTLDLDGGEHLKDHFSLAFSSLKKAESSLSESIL